MNIEERIEALTQSVELLAAMHRDNEKHMRKINENLGSLRDSHIGLVQITERIGTATDNLIAIVHDHEMRLRAVEGV